LVTAPYKNLPVTLMYVCMQVDVCLCVRVGAYLRVIMAIISEYVIDKFVDDIWTKLNVELRSTTRYSFKRLCKRCTFTIQARLRTSRPLSVPVQW